MANPVFDRLDKQITKGDYAGFGGGSTTSRQSGGGGVQDSLNSQQLQDLYNQPSAGAVQMRRVTLDDVVMKTLGLFTILVVFGAASWYAVAGNSGLSLPLILGGMLGGLAVGLLIAFTFSGAAARFDVRRQLIVQEANAIGTATYPPVKNNTSG